MEFIQFGGILKQTMNILQVFAIPRRFLQIGTFFCFVPWHFNALNSKKDAKMYQTIVTFKEKGTKLKIQMESGRPFFFSLPFFGIEKSNQIV